MKTLKQFFTIVIALAALCFTASAQTKKGADIDGEAVGDQSGFSVSMPDANTVAIGAPANSGTGYFAGHVRVYSWNGSSWVQKGADIDAEAAGDNCGFSVSMPDANTVAIGAYANGGTGTFAGHVRVYAWSGSAWVQKGADINGEATFDFSGWSVSMPDANTVAIGAWANDGTGADAGHLRVYAWSGSAWVQKGADINGEAAGDRSGWSVSMPDANTVAIGAYLNDGSGTDAGHVRVYSWSGSAWVQKGADINGEATGDQSGYSVSMPDANTVAIGAIGNSGTGSNAGHVRVYSWSGSAWVQQGVDIDGEAADDNSGFSVSMPDANTVAIGAVGSEGGTFAGHVRVYSWSGSAWVQQGADIDGEAVGDESGRTVSMPDANTVAIGASNNEGNGQQAGHVRVYAFCSENPTISCPANQNQSTDPGTCTYTATGAEFDPTYNDDCPGSTISNNYNNSSSLSGAVFNKGTTSVVWTVTDASGNKSTCSFTVTVNDNEDPAITCPADIAVSNDNGQCDAAVTVPAPTTSDNCTSSTFSFGNALHFDGINDYVSIADNALLDLSTNYTLEAWVKPESNNKRIIDKVPVGTEQGYLMDNFPGQARFINTGGIISGGTVPLGSWTHIACVREAGTPGGVKLYVNGTLVASATTSFATVMNALPLFLGRDQNAGANWWKGVMDEVRIWNVARTQAQVQASMNSEVSPQAGLVAYYNFNQGTAGGNNTGITTLMDASGNGLNGVITNFGMTGSTSNFVAGQTLTISSPVTVTNDYNNTSNASDIYPVGTTNVVWTATDGSGNTSSCTQTITVNDDEDPTIACPTNQTRNTDYGTCSYKAAGNEFDPTFSDNCAGATATNDYNNGSTLNGAVFPTGTTTVTWTVTDANNNSASCSFDVTVVDSEDPVARCKDVTVTLSGGSASISASDVDDGSSDNCGIVSMTVSPSGFDCSNTGSNTVTLTVEDAAGNSSTCISTVTVIGAIPTCSITPIPSNNTYTGGVPTTIYLGYGPQSVTLSASASGGSPFTYSWSGTGTLSCYDCAAPVFAPTTYGNYTFTVVITNSYGCTVSCSITICVIDVQVPGQSNKVYLCHVPPGNGGNPQTLAISVNAVPVHLSLHAGDHLGTCSQSCANPGGSKVAADVPGEFSWSAYPNPFERHFDLVITSTGDERTSLAVYDILGQAVYSQEVSLVAGVNEVEITLPGDVATGVYNVTGVINGEMRVLRLTRTN